MKRHLTAGLIIVLAAASAGLAQEAGPGGLAGLGGFDAPPSHMQAEAITSHIAVAPGGKFHVAVELRIGEGWVYYGPRPGKIAKPAKVTVRAEGLTAGHVLWPGDKPYETDLGDGEKVVNHVYKKHAVIYVPLTVPADAKAGKRSIRIVASGQVCGQTCVDVEAAASASVTVAASPAGNDAWTAELAEGLKSAVPEAGLASLRPKRDTDEPAAVAPAGVADLTIWAGLGLAFLAGLILNVMPCVLPVVPLRILSLAQMAGQKRRRLITLGLAFAGGIVLFFVALAALSAGIRLATQEVFSLSGLFQYRPVRIALAMVLVALAGNLFGVFNVIVPSRIASLGQGAGKSTHGHLSSVGMGLMMAVLATPCSFAILAKALAWAQIVPLWLGTLAILTIGVGMASPHAVLVAFPNLVNKLPKPGRWMELFKQSMGFVLLPVAIWLIFAGSDDAYPGWVIAFGVVLMLGLWMWGTWVRYDSPLRRKIVIRGLAVVLVIAAGFWMLAPPAQSVLNAEKFSLARIESAKQENRLVLVKFSSATCLSCVWLERTVYSDPEVAGELNARNVLVMKADTTDASAPASKMIKERFRGAPPLTVLLPPDGRKPVRLDGKFTKADLFRALDAASKG